MTAIEVKELKKEGKKYIDNADERMVRAVALCLKPTNWKVCGPILAKT